MSVPPVVNVVIELGTAVKHQRAQPTRLEAGGLTAQQWGLPRKPLSLTSKLACTPHCPLLMIGYRHFSRGDLVFSWYIAMCYLSLSCDDVPLSLT